MHKHFIGWDVGGAHLKAALLQADGTPQQVLQVPCALWRGLHELEAGISVIMQAWQTAFTAAETLHAITMTGELVDLFDSRQDGVNAISLLMQEKLTGDKVFYAGIFPRTAKPRFVTIDQVASNWQNIASANWLASATYTAYQLKQDSGISKALLIDIGSTTTDFVAIQNGQPVCLAYTDAGRMQTEELVYSGIIRTPLMALTQKIEFQNHITTLAAEYFATMADVYRLTGDLCDTDDMAETADGKAKTLQASARRLARMLGHDVEDAESADWLALAQAFKRLQLARLSEVAKLHIDRLQETGPGNVVILGAGAGSFLVQEIAAMLDLAYQDSTFALQDSNHHKNLAHWANVCLPAYAVAFLALHHL